MKNLVAGRAALAPLGGVGEENPGYKGYGYSTVVEILSAALQTDPFLSALTGIGNGEKGPCQLGHFFIAINIAHFIEPDQFRKTTGGILRELRNSEKMPGAERINTAGEKEHLASLDRTKNGVPINETLLEEINQIVKDWG